MPSYAVNYEPLTRFDFNTFFSCADRGRIIFWSGKHSKTKHGNPKLSARNYPSNPSAVSFASIATPIRRADCPTRQNAISEFLPPGGISQTQGNQEASYVTRFIYPGKTPFACTPICRENN